MRSSPPHILVRPAAIRENTSAIASRFDGRLVGVTKAVSGHPAVARAMLEGGAEALADARTANLARLGDHTDVHRTAIVVPMPSDLEDRIRVADRTLHSEAAVVRELAHTAADLGLAHEVLVMIDMGDRREGVLPEQLHPMLEAILDLPAIEVVGFGTNVGCFGGVLPTPANMGRFASLVAEARAAFDREFPVVSGGSSVTLPMVEDGTLPDAVTELRVGEAILLGTDITRDRRIPYLRGDAFELRAEVIEVKRKPSTPEGRQGLDATGDEPDFTDRGIRERAILAVGAQDTIPAALTPLTDGIEILGASSDHLVVDTTDSARPIRVGDTIGFRPGYHALVRGAASPDVDLVVEGNAADPAPG